MDTPVHPLYLGTWATVADAEEVGVMMAGKECNRVALDSKGVIQWIWNLQYAPPRSWIEEQLKAQIQRRPRKLMWVRSIRERRGMRKRTRG